MLQLTRAAADQVAEVRREQGFPDTAGLRIFGESRSGGEMAVGLAFAALPAEDDEVIVEQETVVFVAPEVAGPLASASLDIEQTADGAVLVLKPQEPGEVL